MSASDAALADLLANLPTADTSSSPALGPWFAATYRGACADCGSRFEEFDQIRADGEGGWLADCCGNDDDDDTKRQPGESQSLAGIVVTPTAPDPLPALIGQYAPTVASPATKAATAEATTTPRPEDPPPSTVDTMRNVLDQLDRSRPRSQQTALGPSELGTPCQRQIAYKLAGVERQPEDKRPPWAPMQGTAMHVLMEDALRFHNQQLGWERWIIEERLEIDPGLPDTPGIYGHGDAYDTDTDTVVDWKYVGVTTLREVKRKTIPNDRLVKPDYRVQGHLYGRGHERAGRPVKWVRLVFLARSHEYNDSAEWTEAYRPDIADWAVLRYYGTHDLLAALNPIATPALWPAVPATPGKACDWCPFRRVGGPADDSGCPGNTDQKINKQVSGLLA